MSEAIEEIDQPDVIEEGEAWGRCPEHGVVWGEALDITDLTGPECVCGEEIEGKVKFAEKEYTV